MNVRSGEERIRVLPNNVFESRTIDAVRIITIGRRAKGLLIHVRHFHDTKMALSNEALLLY